MSERKCTICGQVFDHPDGRRKKCRDLHEFECFKCGERFEAKSKRSYCSLSCRVLSPKEYTNTCRLCDKVFKSETRTRYCGEDHYSNCKLCEKKYVLDTSKTRFATTCSSECAYKLQRKNQEQTYFEEHGVKT